MTSQQSVNTKIIACFPSSMFFVIIKRDFITDYLNSGFYLRILGSSSLGVLFLEGIVLEWVAWGVRGLFYMLTVYHHRIIMHLWYHINVFIFASPPWTNFYLITQIGPSVFLAGLDILWLEWLCSCNIRGQNLPLGSSSRPLALETSKPRCTRQGH